MPAVAARFLLMGRAGCTGLLGVSGPLPWRAASIFCQSSPSLRPVLQAGPTIKLP
jgi:hypothetical protein